MKTQHYNGEQRYQKNASSHTHLTSLNNIELQKNNGKVPKNPQLTPIKTDSEQRFKLDNKNLSNINNNSANSIGSMNKVKLNPISVNNPHNRRDLSNFN